MNHLHILHSIVYFCLSLFCHGRLSADFINSFILQVSNNVEYSDCDNGDLRLVGGMADSEGTIEVCHSHVWGQHHLNGYTLGL